LDVISLKGKIVSIFLFSHPLSFNHFCKRQF